jgi:hypothetical protein
LSADTHVTFTHSSTAPQPSAGSWPLFQFSIPIPADDGHRAV